MVTKSNSNNNGRYFVICSVTTSVQHLMLAYKLYKSKKHLDEFDLHVKGQK